MNHDDTPCRTLIVEDHPESRSSLKRLLKILGHEVETAATLQEGLAKLAWKPECVILDMMLPDGSGLTILKQIREDQLLAKVAVTTATYDTALMARVRKLNPDTILDKPIDLKRLYAWLHTSGHVNRAFNGPASSPREGIGTAI